MHPCPDCGKKINSEQCPTDAPDFICAPCHLDRLDNDEEWLEQTEARRVQRIIHEGSNPSVTPVDVVADAEEKVAEEAALAIIKQERSEDRNVDDDDLLGTIMGM